MASKIQIVQHAGANEVFGPEAFNCTIGSTVPLTVEGRQISHCRIVAAEVASDGRSVELTVEVPDGIIPPVSLSMG